MLKKYLPGVLRGRRANFLLIGNVFVVYKQKEGDFS
jgi:hypothetical protein